MTRDAYCKLESRVDTRVKSPLALRDCMGMLICMSLEMLNHDMSMLILVGSVVIVGMVSTNKSLKSKDT